MCSCSDLFLCVIAIIFPPIAVWVKRGLCSGDSLINIALCILGYLPGLIHAWYIVSSYPETYERIPDDESQVHVYYVRPQGAGPPGGRGHPPASAGPPPGGHSSPTAPSGSYGTINTQPAPRQLMQPAGPSTTGGPATGKPVAAKMAGADLPETDAGPAPEGGSSERPPPSYSDAVRGNNKIQSHE